MKSNDKKPSLFAELIIRYLGNRKDKHAILGDLEEEFNDRISKDGLLKAKLWCWKLLIISCPSFINEKIYRSMLMLKNYLKIALRNLVKHKGYSFINIIGFSVGMACTIFIVAYIFDELGWEKHHNNYSRIYRMCFETGMEKTKIAYSPPPLSKALLEDFPEVENAVRFSYWPINLLVAYEDRRFLEKKILYADSSIFNVFTIPFLEGDRNTALTRPNTVVITKDIAEKYFGSENPIGKTLSFYSSRVPYEVTGVVENCPEKTYFRFDLIVSFVTTGQHNSDRWMGHSCFTYILLRENYPVEQLDAKLPDFFKRHYGPQLFQDSGVTFDEHFDSEENHYRYWMQPLSDIHFGTDVIDNSLTKGDLIYIYIFSSVALFIILIACINFMNLSTARYVSRSKEVGMRKVMGSGRWQIVRQLLSESVLLSALSLVLALIIIKAGEPLFNNITGKQIEISYLNNYYTLPVLIIFAVLIGFSSGIYPAMFLSSFQPISTLKGAFKGKSGSALSLRRCLVLVQFSISIIILLGTFIVYSQLDYIQNEKLGFNKAHILVIHRAGALGDRQETFRNELLNGPGISCVSVTESLPGRHFNPNGHTLEGENPSEERPIWTMYGDHEFADLIDLEIVEGRFFSKEIASDENAVVINETAVNQLGLSEPLGKRFRKEFGNYREGDYVTIIGVVKDINFQSLHNEINPMIIRNIRGNRGDYISLKVDPENTGEILSYVEDKWRTFTGNQPFEYSFLDDDLNELYKSEHKMGYTFVVFAVIAICIACLGLFGLISYSSEQRTKEIGIRKALGARITTIVYLLSKEIAVLVVISSLAASPIAYYVMHKWLQNFAFRISVDPLIFFLTAVLVLGIALLTVSYQAVKAARANPVKSLRYE
ncbi:ABC transporter permease [candidate division KSB1 bacterium]